MNYETICSISTAPGQGAIAIVRISGQQALKICQKIFQPHNKKKFSFQNTQKVLLGNIVEKNKIIDEVIVTIFQEPKSYTGENMIEISCHGSTYIQSKIIHILIKHGCRIAKKGEFTLRAFLNGKIDLSQAEGVANLISSENEKAHDLAMKQMRGGFSNEIKLLREKFIKFASLIELELDFSQEDVEFADRKALLQLIQKIEIKISALIKSFQLGNAIKNGIPIALVGHPNSGKSTLLNKILNEDRAIVSNIKGTTRDTIEENVTLNGYKFRFIDTAGIRETKNQVEKIGISKTYQKITESAFVLYLIDKSDFNPKEIEKEIQKIEKIINEHTCLMIIANKSDLSKKSIDLNNIKHINTINISAKNGDGIDDVIKLILNRIEEIEGLNNNIVVINHRHFESLVNTMQNIQEIKKGLSTNLSGEFLSIDIKNCLQHLGEITGEITNDNLLDSIFKDFCIGK